MKLINIAFILILGKLNFSPTRLITDNSAIMSYQQARPLYIINLNDSTVVTQDLIINSSKVEKMSNLSHYNLSRRYSQFSTINANLFFEVTLARSVKLLNMFEILKIYKISNSANLPITINGIPTINGKLLLADKNEIASVLIDPKLNCVDITTIDKNRSEQYRMEKIKGDKELSDKFKKGTPQQVISGGKIPGFYPNN